MKHLIIIAAMLCALTASAQSFVTNGNSYSVSKSSTTKAEVVPTPYTYNIKGVEYPIFLSSNGYAFIIRTSQKSGNEYKQYLGEEISKDICSKLGVTYKGK